MIIRVCLLFLSSRFCFLRFANPNNSPYFCPHIVGSRLCTMKKLFVCILLLGFCGICAVRAQDGVRRVESLNFGSAQWEKPGATAQ